MHRLLMERGEIIDRLIAVKKTSESGSAFRPGREAAMMRALAERHEGLLPLDTAEGIWRVIIATFTYVQAPFAVHADVSGGDAPMRDSARFHFGFTRALQAACERRRRDRGGRAGARRSRHLPPRPGRLRRRLVARPRRRRSGPKVIARLPFIERPNHPAGTPVFVISKPLADAAVRDVVLYSAPFDRWREGAGRVIAAFGGEVIANAGGGHGLSALLALPGSLEPAALRNAAAADGRASLRSRRDRQPRRALRGRRSEIAASSTSASCHGVRISQTARMCRCHRRAFLALAGGLLASAADRQAPRPGRAIAHRFIAEAFRMRREAEAAGDQPYGAVVVLGESIVGFGPSQRRDERRSRSPCRAGRDPRRPDPAQPIRSLGRRHVLDLPALPGLRAGCRRRADRTHDLWAGWQPMRAHRGRRAADAATAGFCARAGPCFEFHVRRPRRRRSGARLLRAAAAGDLAETRRLIGGGAPVDARDAQRRTALLLAVDANHVELARALLDAGASVDAQAANLDTPWLLAGARGRTAIIAMMLPKKPDLSIRNRFGGNALIPACERAHVEAVPLLLQAGIDVNHVNNLGWTCLLEIVILGDGGPRHQEVARLVLAAGADPNLADKDGRHAARPRPQPRPAGGRPPDRGFRRPHAA